MIVVVNRLKVPPDLTARIEQGFGHATGMREVPGCAGFEFWRDAEDGEYEVVTRWDSREDYDRWRESDAFKRAHQHTGGMERIASRLIVYEVLIGA